MPNEIYHRSNWGESKAEGFGDVYYDHAATNKLYNHSDYYENSDGTDATLKDLNNKASIVLTPTAYSDGSLNTVIPPYQVLPTELVTNGTFDTDSDWTKGSGWSISSGTANANSASSSYFYQTINELAVGKTYSITYTITSYTSGSVVTGIGDLLGNRGTTRNAIGTYTDIITFSSNTTNDYFGFFATSSFTGSIDNVSVKEIQEADFDFSRGSSATRVNEQGLVEDSQGDDYPRIDFTDGTGSLLLEPQSTNLIGYSIPNNTNWSKGTNTTITEDYAVSPDGTQNASRLVMPTGSGTYVYYQFTATSTTDHTLSFYAKNNGGDADVTMAFFAASQTQNITLTNEWQRFEFTTSITSGNVVQVGVDNITSVDMLIYGVQCEALSYATSYIVSNSGSATTRSADVANNSGNADLFNDSEGVLYAEFSAISDDSVFKAIAISDGTSSGDDNRVNIAYLNSNLYANVRVGNVYQFNDNVSVDVETFNKVALKYKENDFSVFVNGVQVLTDTSGSTFSGNVLSELAFDDGQGNSNFNGNVKCVAVFKEALSNDLLERLTGEGYESFRLLAEANNYTII